MIIDDYIKFRQEYEKKMLGIYGEVRIRERALTKLFIQERKELSEQ